MPNEQAPVKPAKLRRTIGLPLLTLYGLGTTIGAGIYVLVGTTTAVAGIYAPAAFLLAAIVMAFSAASFAEFSGRVPLSAGEAAYVNAGFGTNWLTLATGLTIVLSACVAAAAIAIGCAGYIATIIPVPISVIVPVIILSMGGLAAWGVKQSVLIAGILTVIEIIGLLIIIVAGVIAQPAILIEVNQVIPSVDDMANWTLVAGAALIAFFAFIGFDDVVNLAEETQSPERVLPIAIFITLIAVTAIYMLVATVAVRTLPINELAETRAPIRLLFEALTDFPSLSITLIAIVATINGVVIQIIMASRVIYGLGRQGKLPAALAVIHPHTRTPVRATILVVLLVLAGASLTSLETLAAFTSQLILAVFTLVNLSLIRVKLRGDPVPDNAMKVPLVIPVFGVICCMGLIILPVAVG